MMRRIVFLILSGFILLPFSGCQTSHKETRDSKVDKELATKKASPSGLQVGEILTEPQTGFIQEPKQSQ